MNNVYNHFVIKNSYSKEAETEAIETNAKILNLQFCILNYYTNDILTILSIYWLIHVCYSLELSRKRQRRTI